VDWACSRNGRLWNAFDREAQVERKTARMNQPPTRRFRFAQLNRLTPLWSSTNVVGIVPGRAVKPAHIVNRASGEEGLTERRRPLTKMKLLAAVFLSAAITTPAFAQEFRAHGPTHHVRSHNHQSVHAEDAASLTGEEYRNLESYGFSGKDPSRVGGEDADLNVSGNECIGKMFRGANLCSAIIRRH
jgi:hypothetical protein